MYFNIANAFIDFVHTIQYLISYNYENKATDQR